MKLIINYDFFEKIESANGVIHLNRIVQKNLKIQSIIYGGPLLICMFFIGPNPLEFLKKYIVYPIMWTSVWSIMDVILAKKNSEINMRKAYNSLVKLSKQLSDLNVSTSADLLKESELIKKECKVVFNDKYRPIIKQNKYVMIPTYNNGDIKDTCILQEHEIGSKQYVLSIGSPSRSFKLAYAQN